MRKLLRKSSRWARYGLVAVLLTINGFAVWSSITTGRLGQEAIASSVLSDHYTAAATAAAAAAAKSLESKYRLDPSPKIRRSFKTVVAQLIIALERIHRSGSPADHLLVEDARTALTSYLESINKMFNGVDRGDDARVHRIDYEEAAPRFETIERAVLQAAADQHEEPIRSPEKLRTRKAFNANSTPIVFIAGLLLTGLFAQVLWRMRVELDSQREDVLHASLHDKLTGLANRTLLLRSADDMEREGLITSTEWRKLVQQAGTLFARTAECMRKGK
ncbi:MULTISPECIES: hypothetical protein [Gammaproteobacteria]|uniref:hypothetical protein n=1 Tax=Gammaproteobacteria TaxID=1236 RepID=UPI0019138689|nr:MULTISPECIES: hypothetical protein [Gammaproteobacteria]MBK5304321.1 hypothetical protein [Bacillus sp. TH86]MBK5324090.1 hypothetical protein [Bacillus sp. TH59]MBK5339040.1 hypothetical protein [Bacillus sp. TH57]MBK5313091.1 hypothetical protein [Pseudomonas sp. TH71]MBK5318588.1 hypothetical protein [Erwinia sp. TH79]